MSETAGSFGFIARRARWCPRWLWWMSSSKPTVFLEDQSSAGRTVTRVRWGRPGRIAVGPHGARVDVSYAAHNWSNANKASFTAYPGDDIEYSATWWPWQRGRFTIRHNQAGEPEC